MSLLSSITNSVQEAKELGRKSAVVETIRVGGRRGGGGFPDMHGGIGIGSGRAVVGDIFMGGSEESSGFGGGGVGMEKEG